MIPENNKVYFPLISQASQVREYHKIPPSKTNNDLWMQMQRNECILFKSIRERLCLQQNSDLC